MVLSAAAVLLAGRLVVALVLIPPWQLPDEQAHVAVAEVFRSRVSSQTFSSRGRQAEILESMAEHEWWRYYGVPSPAPLPSRFPLLLVDNAASALAVNVESPEHPKPYYTLIAGLLLLAPPMPVVRDLYVMRFVAALFGMLTLWTAWRGAREGLGERGGAAITVLLALHPQFAVVSTTASADTLIILLGACMWWQAMLALNRANFLVPLGVMWVAAMAAAVTDRMGVPLVASALVLSVVVAVHRTGLGRKTVALAIIGVILTGAVLGFVEGQSRAFGHAIGVMLRTPPEYLDYTWGFLATFTSVIFESWWFALGWLRYPPPDWWLGVALVLSVGSVLGLMARLVRGEEAHTRLVAVMAVTMLAVQVAAVSWVYVTISHGAQGKHLFPALVPTLVLVWLGAQALAPVRFRRHAAVGLVLAFALLDCAAWGMVAITTYVG